MSDVLGEALGKFFRDLVYTAPEAWHDRVMQLANATLPELDRLGIEHPFKKKTDDETD